MTIELQSSPSGSGAYAASNCTATGLLSVHGDAILLALGQRVLHAFLDFALISFAGGNALHADRTAGHLLTAVLDVHFVTPTVVWQVGCLQLSISQVLHCHLAR